MHDRTGAAGGGHGDLQQGRVHGGTGGESGSESPELFSSQFLSCSSQVSVGLGRRGRPSARRRTPTHPTPDTLNHPAYSVGLAAPH
jgi:hypothetical protein